MEIRDLDYFLACCQAGSFTAAARQAHIVQSAMSAAVARLEHELGVSLFDRSVTPVTVTEHGAALQAAAQRILEAVQAARDDVAAVSGRVHGTVTLGCTLHTGPLDLAAVLAALRDRHPGVVVHLRQSLAGSAGNLQAVIDGSMDIALTASPADPGPGRPPRGVLLTPLVSEPLVFICPAGHRLSRRDRVATADLADETILRFPPGWGIRATVDAVLGADPSAIEIGDYALMLQLVRSRFGTTLLPASALTAGHPGLVAVPADDPRLAWDLSAAISATRQPTAAATALLTALTQAAAARGPKTTPPRGALGGLARATDVTKCQESLHRPRSDLVTRITSAPGVTATRIVRQFRPFRGQKLTNDLQGGSPGQLPGMAVLAARAGDLSAVSGALTPGTADKPGRLPGRQRGGPE